MTLPVTGVFEATDNLILKGGLLVYADNNRSRLVTAHTAVEPEVKGGTPRLGPGKLVSRDSVLELFKGLDNVPQERFFLPERCLCWEANMMAFWVPASRRRIFFNAHNDALNSISGTEVMHPPLMFRVQAGEICVWALNKDERPRPDTRLCRAPYFNVYESANMCIGSVQLPGQPRPDQIHLWEECFFGSNFTHGNAQALLNGKNHTEYWKALSKPNSTKAYAMRYLRELPLTVSQSLKGGTKDERR